jgi:hypothetical protein
MDHQPLEMDQPLNPNVERDQKGVSKGTKLRNKYQDDITSFDLTAVSQIRTGLVRDRGCTDILCYFLVVATIVGMFGCSIYGYSKGNIHALISPIDGTNHICGATPEYKGYNFLYFTNLEDEVIDLKKIFRNAVCVKTCPSADTNVPVDCKTNAQVPDCNSGTITAYRYDTLNILGLCIPAHSDQLEGPIKNTWDGIKQQLESSSVGSSFEDIKSCKSAIIICIFVSFVYATLYIYAMSIFPTQLAWLAVLVVEFFLVGVAGLSLFASTRAATSQKNGYLIVGIVFLFLLLVFNCLLCCYRTQFKIAIAVVDASADFLAATKRLILTSFLFFIFQVIILAVWVTGMAFIFSTNEVTPNQNLELGSYQFKSINVAGSSKGISAFMFVGIIWVYIWICD